LSITIIICGKTCYDGINSVSIYVKNVFTPKHKSCKISDKAHQSAYIATAIKNGAETKMALIKQNPGVCLFPQLLYLTRSPWHLRLESTQKEVMLVHLQINMKPISLPRSNPTSCHAGRQSTAEKFPALFKAHLWQSFKEGPLTKNGPIDFAQSWAIHMKKSN